MTRSQKILISLLVTGHFLRKFQHGEKVWYVVYDKKVNPVLKAFERTVKPISNYEPSGLKIWKKDRDGSMSLNLQTVRRLHGKTMLKQLYKKRHQIENGAPIYKTWLRNNRKKSLNEKNYRLF